MGINRKKPLKNEAENELLQKAQSQGWSVTKKGWPDFIMWRNGRLVCVEVKRRAHHKLKREQVS